MKSVFKALIHGTILTGNGMITGRALLIRDEIIAGIAGTESIPAGAEKTDCTGYFIAPGFLDLQIAGAGGFLYSANLNPFALRSITESILKSGTTSFLIVLPTNSPEVYRDAIKTIKKNPHPALLGLHLEGPYISREKRGAHAVAHIRKPDLKDIELLLKSGEGIIRMMTLAPELCTPEIIRLISDYNVVPCAGHSNATFGQAGKGFKWGIRATTHLFNAMSPLHHRDTGLPGATFMNDNVFASIVADGIHVDYPMISIARRVMKERLYLVSDAVEESSDPACRHVRQKDRFTLPDGTLSGSVLTMMKAVQNCIQYAGIGPEEAVRMASLYPAKLMGLTDRGVIEEGKKADLVVFDKDYNVKNVIKNGSSVLFTDDDAG